MKNSKRPGNALAFFFVGYIGILILFGPADTIYQLPAILVGIAAVIAETRDE